MSLKAKLLIALALTENEILSFFLNYFVIIIIFIPTWVPASTSANSAQIILIIIFKIIIIIKILFVRPLVYVLRASVWIKEDIKKLDLLCITSHLNRINELK